MSCLALQIEWGRTFLWFVVNFCHKPIILRKSES